MFDKVNIKNLGVIENMSYHICPNCEHKTHLFGKNGGASLAQESNINLIGQVPLNINIRQETDNGCPSVIHDPESEISQIFCKMARIISHKIAKLPRSYAHIMPNVKVTSKT
tara:strand:- start:219 stop:554 length:336 start_codon:yes stop_codon:yes gene_type:complete